MEEADPGRIYSYYKPQPLVFGPQTRVGVDGAPVPAVEVFPAVEDPEAMRRNMTLLGLRRDTTLRRTGDEEESDCECPFKDPDETGSTAGTVTKFHTTPSWVVDQAERSTKF